MTRPYPKKTDNLVFLLQVYTVYSQLHNDRIRVFDLVSETKARHMTVRLEPFIDNKIEKGLMDPEFYGAYFKKMFVNNNVKY